MTSDSTAIDENIALAKEDALRERLAGFGSLAVAYSGGVDSSYLAAVAAEALGDRVTLVLADSPSLPRAERTAALELAEARGWPVEVFATEEFNRPDFARNDERRCYYCKDEVFARMETYAAERRVHVLAYGAILDDLGDHRPGADAAAAHAVVAPLQDAGLSKAEIRFLSGRRGLPTASKASFACLASRLPTGTAVTAERLQQVEAAEDVLRGLGFRQFRCRHHGPVCRIEVETADFPLLVQDGVRDQVVAGVQAAGYRHVALDLAGYRTGSTAGAAGRT
jgi:uncharacterized protein